MALPEVVYNTLMAAGQNVRQYMDKVDDPQGLKDLVKELVEIATLAQLKDCILTEDHDKEDPFYYKLPASARNEGAKKMKIGTFLGGVLSQTKWLSMDRR